MTYDYRSAALCVSQSVMYLLCGGDRNWIFSGLRNFHCGFFFFFCYSYNSNKKKPISYSLIIKEFQTVGNPDNGITFIRRWLVVTATAVHSYIAERSSIITLRFSARIGKYRVVEEANLKFKNSVSNELVYITKPLKNRSKGTLIFVF